jgi:hypothetical protein
MNADEWDTSEHALPMLEALDARTFDGPLRTFACPCCRPLRHLLPSESRQALSTVQAYAAGRASAADLAAAHAVAQAGRRHVGESPGHGKRKKLRTSERIAVVVEWVTSPDAWQAAREAILVAVDLCGWQPAELLRQFVENPFRGRDGRS